MICPNCDKEIESDIEHCPHCGCHFPISEKMKREQERLAREQREREEKARQEQKRQEQLRKEQEKREEQKRKEQERARQAELERVKREQKKKEEAEKKQREVAEKKQKEEQERKLREEAEKRRQEELKNSTPCPYCGKPLREGAIFCKWCGKSLQQSDEVQEKQEIARHEMTECQQQTVNGEDARLDQMESTQPQTKEGQAIGEKQQEQNTVPCPQCGKPLREGALFCRWCGVSLNPKDDIQGTLVIVAHKCPKCGNDLKPSAKFCNKCGQKIQCN